MWMMGEIANAPFLRTDYCLCNILLVFYLYWLSGRSSDWWCVMAKKIIAYKAFNKDMTCRGFQFEVGKKYKHEGDIEICKSGFHACKSPLDCWGYYDLTQSRFAEVELSGKKKKDGADTKIAAAKIKIKAELTLPEFIKRGVDWVVARTDGKNTKKKIGSSGHHAQIGSSGDSAQIGSSGDSAHIGSSGHHAQIGSSGDSAHIGSSGHHAQIGSSGDSAQIGSSGHYAQIGSSGDSAQIGSSGNYARIGSSGDYAQIGSSGDSAQIGSSGNYARIGSSGDYARIGSSRHYAHIGSSGDSAHIGSSGDYAQIGSSGDYAHIGSSGDSARIGSSGHYAHIKSEGEKAVVASAGCGTKVKAKKGAWVSLAEFKNGECVGFATGCIGKKGLKPDTWYKAESGKLVEVE